MTTAEIVSSVIAGLGVITALVTILRTTKREEKCDIAADEALRADVKYLVRGMDEMRAEVKGIRQDHGKQLQGHERRITRLETMHKLSMDDEEY